MCASSVLLHKRLFQEDASEVVKAIYEDLVHQVSEDRGNVEVAK